ncbi:Uncharacterized protein HDE_05272 [Halotydeus destructor]|nr:Uncharacterized protein HDE_05272 [Halotydeus destructor]
MGFIAEFVLALVFLVVSTFFVSNFLSRLISWYLTRLTGFGVKINSLGCFYAGGLVVCLPSGVSFEIGKVQLVTSLRKLLLLLFKSSQDDAIRLDFSLSSLICGEFKLTITSASFDWSKTRMEFNLSNSRVDSLVPLTYQQKMTNTLHTAMKIKGFRIVLDKKARERSFEMTEEVILRWHPSFHLTVCELIKHIKGHISEFKKSPSPEAPVNSAFSTLVVRAEGNISIGALLSNCGQTISFNGENFNLILPARKTMSIKSDRICMVCDDRQIINCDDVDILMVTADDGSCIVDRKSMAGSLEMDKNRALLLSFDSVQITFPHGYNFAANFSDKFMTNTKWLRKFHKKSKQQDYVTVAMDMAIRIKSLSMEIEDDPFEIRLRNNYELLEDEYYESQKRQHVLNERIESLRRQNIPDSKLQEIRNKLAEKDAEIYMERHKKLYTNLSGFRKNLLTLLADGINLQAAADSSMTGYERLTDIMRHQLDVASPMPEEVRFSTLWCRKVRGTIGRIVCRLRDFPKPFQAIERLRIFGTLMGAEQEASMRARRTGFVDMGQHANSVPLERTMPSLKFYHDMTLKVDAWDYTHGACWEPILAQVSLSFELISRPSLDPSPGLTWFDKMRLLFHGPLIVEAHSFSLFFHASLDPYNSTELVEMAFTRTIIQWLTGRIFIKGNLDFLIHTASKYDECRIVHLPNLDIQVYLDWLCVGNQYDHHSVMPCAADKVPEYSSNQVHDSYRAFRSHNLNVKLSFETKQPVVARDDDIPSILLYGSSVRWFDNQKQMFSGVPKPTRRGVLFGNIKPRKLAFSRVFKKVRVSVHLHKLKAAYWSSFSKTWGCQVLGDSLSHSAEHSLTLVPYDDGLSRRPRPAWSMTYMNTEINDVEIWLYNNRIAASADEEESGSESRKNFLNISRVSYNRDNKEDILRTETTDDVSSPTHRLVVHDLRGAWTKANKDVCFALFDTFIKAQQLKRNLSTEALKMFNVKGVQTLHVGSSPTKSRHSATSPGSTLNKGYAHTMLQRLIAESENNPNVVYTEDVESEFANDGLKLKGVTACQDDDVIIKNWLIELINSQVMLRGCETSGYIIVSAAKTQLWQKVHRPVWKDRTLYSKHSWVGSVECMQYYATVDANIDIDSVWLSVENIQEKELTTVSDLPDLVGSSQSVGGIINETLFGLNEQGSGNGLSVQLQRIISRCSCQFFFAYFSEDIDQAEVKEVPPLPDEDDLFSPEPWEEETAVDYFTLMHHELDIFTNSQQFEMIIDLFNNLLLYVEPHKKEAAEKLQSLRFKFQLNPDVDQREPITELQNQLRELVILEKQREKDLYIAQRTLDEDSTMCDEAREHLTKELESIEEEADKCKAKTNILNDELAMMIMCYKEAQITADKTKERREAAASGHFVSSVIKRIEVCFKQASWRLTDADGQLGLADMILRNFLYTKVAKNDDSVEHSLELGYICVENMLPSQAHKIVLEPTTLEDNIPLDKQRALRIFCRERAPVAGISVKEHFEVNVIPLTIGMTHAFFKKMVSFFFPGPEVTAQEKTGRRRRGHKKTTDNETTSVAASVASSANNSSVNEKGDRVAANKKQSESGTEIEKMRERAQKNQTFVYIKIPEVPIRVSYKGSKNKNLEDISNFTLILPTIEYHNQTWTWLDVLMAIKNESRNRLLAQAVKQKFHFKSSQVPANQVESCLPPPQINQEEEEERKARLLLGSAAFAHQAHPKSSGAFSFLKRK